MGAVRGCSNALMEGDADGIVDLLLLLMDFVSLLLSMISFTSMDFNRLGVNDMRTVSPDLIKSSKSTMVGESGLYTEMAIGLLLLLLLLFLCCGDCASCVDPRRLKRRGNLFLLLVPLLPEELVELIVLVLVLVLIIDIGLWCCLCPAELVVVVGLQGKSASLLWLLLLLSLSKFGMSAYGSTGRPLEEHDSRLCCFLLLVFCISDHGICCCCICCCCRIL